MKKTIVLCLLAVLTGSLYAQKPKATFFSEDGHKFWVIMDGLRKNPEPQYRVDNVELQNDWAKVKIIFENPEIPEIEKTIQGVDVDGKPLSAVWVIKQTNKGKWVLRPSSWGEITENQESGGGEKQPPVRQDVPERVNEPAGEQDMTGNEVNAGISVQANETGVNMEINMQEPTREMNAGIDMNVRTEQQQSTQTYGNIDMPPAPYEEAGKEKKEPVTDECITAASDSDFREMKESISSGSFEETKFSIAKQILNSNCLSSAQIKEIMEIFNFEETRLDFAKLAYHKAVDKNNFYKVNSAFTFESTIEELNEYLDEVR